MLRHDVNGALQNKFDRWDYSLSQLVSEIQKETVFRFIVKHITRPLDKIFKSNQVKFITVGLWDTCMALTWVTHGRRHLSIMWWMDAKTRLTKDIFTNCFSSWLSCRIPCHSFKCHWKRITFIVLCLHLRSVPTHINEVDQSGTVFCSCSFALYSNIIKWKRM